MKARPIIILTLEDGEDIERFLEKINGASYVSHKSSNSSHEIKPTTAMIPSDGVEMASEDAKRALWAAAQNNGTDIETVCRQYNVNPDHISKRDCWRMTQDLNAKTGYGKEQQERLSEPSSKHQRGSRSKTKAGNGDGFFDD